MATALWEHQIRDELDLQRHVEYIHYNPVKHGHVLQVKDWPYSSFHSYVEKECIGLDWGGLVNESVGGDWGVIPGLRGASSGLHIYKYYKVDY